MSDRFCDACGTMLRHLEVHTSERCVVFMQAILRASDIDRRDLRAKLALAEELEIAVVELLVRVKWMTSINTSEVDNAVRAFRAAMPKKEGG